MRIAFITPEFVTEPSYSGGLANYLGRVTVALAAEGHDIHVFTRSTTPNESIQFQGVTVHRVLPLWDQRMILDHVDPLVPRRLYNPYQDLKAAWCLWQAWLKIHGENPFDLTQVANVMAVGLFFRFSNKQAKLVTRLSSYRPLWDTAAGIPINLGVKLRWTMERWAITGLPYAYAPTSFVAQATELNYAMTNIQVIESPFYLEEETQELDLFNQYAQHKQYLLFFGRMTQMKGVHVLVEALKKILVQQQDIHVFFIGNDAIAPDGGKMSDYIKAELREFISSRVMVLGSVRHDRLYPFIMNARLIVLPSLMDNLPNTCLEAMGIGKVVIATTNSCFEQVITSGLSGFLVCPNDSKALEEKILEVWQLDDQTLIKVGEAAKEAISRLHPDHAIPRLIAYYESLINI